MVRGLKGIRSAKHRSYIPVKFVWPPARRSSPSIERMLLTHAAFALFSPQHAHSVPRARTRGITLCQPPGRTATLPSLPPLDKDVAAQKRRARKARWRKGAKERQETAMIELVERLEPPFGAATLDDAYSPELTEALRRHSVDWEAAPCVDM